MTTFKNFNLVEITKLQSDVNLIDCKITFLSDDLDTDIREKILEKGNGIYKVKRKDKIEYWFFLNNNFVVYPNDMTTEEIKNYIDWINILCGWRQY